MTEQNNKNIYKKKVFQRFEKRSYVKLRHPLRYRKGYLRHMTYAHVPETHPWSSHDWRDQESICIKVRYLYEGHTIVCTQLHL